MNQNQQPHDRRTHRTIDRPKPNAEECLLQTLEAIRALDDARMVAPNRDGMKARDRLKGVDSELWNVVEALQGDLYDDEGDGDEGDGDDPLPRGVTDGGTVTACPECDGTNIHRRSDGLGPSREGDPDAKWRCSDCQARFDEPIDRAPKAGYPGAGNSGLGKKLVEADKDAIPDGGKERERREIANAATRDEREAAAVIANRRQADAMEDVALELKRTNAALAETIRTLDEVAAAADTSDGRPRDEQLRSLRSVESAIRDHAHTRDEADEDALWTDALTDGGAVEAADEGETVDDPVVPGTAARGLRLFHVEILRAIALIERAGEEPYGLAIKSRLENWFESEVNHGRLYPNLDELVEGRLVEKSQLDKRTNCYTLTDEGRAVLTERTLELADAADLEVREDG